MSAEGVAGGGKLDCSVVGSTVDVLGWSERARPRSGALMFLMARGWPRDHGEEEKTSALGRNGVSCASMLTNCWKMFFFCSKFFLRVLRTVEESLSWGTVLKLFL